MRIDAHQHFWRLARGDYGWLTEAEHPVLFRDYLARDLAPLIKDARIERTILVQAAPTLAETEFLLGLAGETEFVAGVVGWVDFESSDPATTIARLATNEKLVGLRPMIQDLADDRWMLSSTLEPALGAIEVNDLAFDALVKPRHLPVLAEFLSRHPELRVVIDHGAKPDIARSALADWAPAMREIARSSCAVCKLSGLVTEAGRDWSAAKLKPFIDVLLDAFGPERLMWGSDWPVLNEAGDYAAWLDAAETLTARLSARERERIFGGTAAEFYRLRPRSSRSKSV